MAKCTIKKLALTAVKPNPENLRFTGETVMEGVKVQSTLNLPIMMQLIREQGTLPGAKLVVEKTGDEYIVLCGNRRWYAAMALLADPTTPQSLVDTLNGKFDMEVYEGITSYERQNIVNDQKDQRYLRSELVRFAWQLQASGMNYPEIAWAIWPNMVPYASQGARKAAEINAAPNDEERKKIVQVWLKGTLYGIILACGKLGPRVRKALLLSELNTDGIKTDEKPEFKPTQQRCRLLAEADKSGSSEAFNKLIESFAQADNPARAAEGGNAGEDGHEPEPTARRKSVEELQAHQKAYMQSTVGKRTLDFALGKVCPDLQILDAEATRCERIVNILVKEKDRFKPEVADLLSAMLKSDELMFEAVLQKYLS